MNKKIFSFIVFLLLFTSFRFVNANYLVDDSFETGTYNSSFFYNQSCCSHSLNFVNSLTNIPVKYGNYMMRVNLSSDDAFVASGSRAELSSAYYNTTYGDEYWYGLSIFIPNDWLNETSPTDNWNIFAQWHVYPTPGEIATSPVVALELDSNRLYVYNRNSTVYNLTNSSQVTTTSWLIGDPLKGEWDDYVFHMIWNSNSSGLLEVWRNDVLVVNKTGGVTYNDTIGPYWKIGMYRSNLSVSPRVHYVDEIKMGDSTSSYAEVMPRSSAALNNTFNFGGNSKITFGGNSKITFS